jgi:zinc protease
VYGKNTPYGWDDEYDTINRVTRADLAGFYRRYFFPANTMLAVWGDFSAPEMKARLEKLFADWTVGTAARAGLSAGCRQTRRGHLPGSQVRRHADVFFHGAIGRRAQRQGLPGAGNHGRHFGRRISEPPVPQVRTEMGNAYEIEADWGANYDHPGLFTISGSTKSVSTVETLQAILEEVERIRSPK